MNETRTIRKPLRIGAHQRNTTSGYAPDGRYVLGAVDGRHGAGEMQSAMSGRVRLMSQRPRGCLQIAAADDTTFRSPTDR